MQLFYIPSLLFLSGAAVRAQTPVPNPTATSLGDPANILSYPICAQICSNETTAAENAPCDGTTQECLCGAVFRSATASCEKIACSGKDYNRTQVLAGQLCDPLYSSSAQLGASVTSAIASRTSFAASAVATVDPTSSQTWPACGRACLAQYLPSSGCGSLSNRTCACQNSAFNEAIDPCFTTKCSTMDYQVLQFIAIELCNPIGGTGNGSNASISAALSTPTPSAFAGGAGAVSAGGWMGAWVGATVAGLLMAVWL